MNMSHNAPVEQRIPVTILCGFLGAGKTTLLKQVLEAPQGLRFAVLVNDFGAINIDAALIVETGAEQMSLANGCICCSIRDDLVDAVGQILRNPTAFDRLIIEASGVSRPLSIIEALEHTDIADRVVLDASVCIVDAEQFLDLDYASSELAIDQAVSSDLLLLNKCDLVGVTQVDKVAAALSEVVPGIIPLRTSFARVEFDVLFGLGDNNRSPTRFGGSIGRPKSRGAQHHAHPDHPHSHHNHDDEFESLAWTSVRPLSLQGFRSTVRNFPVGLLRAKGVVCVQDGGGVHKAVFHLVGKRRTVTVEDGPAPEISQVVAIARRGALDGHALQTLLDGCTVPD
jgi:G3E family GTPase